MTAVHQTFAPFLRAACPIPPMPSTRPETSRVQAQCDAQAAIIKRMQPPRCPIGWLEYVYRIGPVEFVCHLEYDKGEKGIDGPDIAPRTNLICAYIRGMEVSEYLDADIIKLIETKAAASLEE